MLKVFGAARTNRARRAGLIRDLSLPKLYDLPTGVSPTDRDATTSGVRECAVSGSENEEESKWGET